MIFTSFNTEDLNATRLEPWPEQSYPLTEEELEELWFLYVLEFGHLLDIPVRAISSRSRETTHRFWCHRSPIRTSYMHQNTSPVAASLIQISIT